MKRTAFRKLHNALARKTGTRLTAKDIEQLFANENFAMVCSIAAYPHDPKSRGARQVQAAVDSLKKCPACQGDGKVMGYSGDPKRPLIAVQCPLCKGKK